RRRGAPAALRCRHAAGDLFRAATALQEAVAGRPRGPGATRGLRSMITIASGWPADGTAYAWRTHASDDIDYSSWSPWCEFVVDNTAPLPPQVASTELNGRMSPTVPGTPAST